MGVESDKSGVSITVRDGKGVLINSLMRPIDPQGEGYEGLLRSLRETQEEANTALTNLISSNKPTTPQHDKEPTSHPPGDTQSKSHKRQQAADSTEPSDSKKLCS